MSLKQNKKIIENLAVDLTNKYNKYKHSNQMKHIEIHVRVFFFKKRLTMLIKFPTMQIKTVLTKPAEHPASLQLAMFPML